MHHLMANVAIFTNLLVYKICKLSLFTSGNHGDRVIVVNKFAIQVQILYPRKQFAELQYKLNYKLRYKL